MHVRGRYVFVWMILIAAIPVAGSAKEEVVCQIFGEVISLGRQSYFQPVKVQSDVSVFEVVVTELNMRLDSISMDKERTRSLFGISADDSYCQRWEVGHIVPFGLCENQDILPGDRVWAHTGGWPGSEVPCLHGITKQE